MIVIFCDSVLDHKVIDLDYQEEQESAKRAGLDCALISFEELIDGNVSKALRFIKKSLDKEFAVYRGWMLTPNQYENLYKGLLTLNIELINAPTEYKHCHYLPESYDKIKSKTPNSNWTTLIDLDEIIALASPFGANPIIVKDFVKSEKHNWEDACYIPNASDTDAVKNVVSKFLKLRGDSLNKGIVFREFIELDFLTKHSKSGMPLTREFRAFYVNNKLLKVFNYWEEGEYGETDIVMDEFNEIAKNIESNFFTMDIAKTKSGNWIIMELGDGQVAGLPDNADKYVFYSDLKVALLS